MSQKVTTIPVPVFLVMDGDETMRHPIGQSGIFMTKKAAQNYCKRLQWHSQNPKMFFVQTAIVTKSPKGK